MATNELAYGFSSLEQFLSERVTTAGVNVVTRAIEESSAEWTRATNALLSLMAERTTVHQERYLLPGTGSLQRLDEFGIPRVVAPSGYYDVAYPILGGGTAFGRNRVTSALETVAEINRDQITAEQQDAVWLRRHMLAALLDNTTWVYDDPQYGNLTIQPLANNDTVTFNHVGGSVATANHYLAQTAAIADATNPYDTIYSTLTAYPSNQGREIISFIPTDLVATTEALADFVPVGDSAIVLGASDDRLAVDASVFRGMGDVVLGRVSKQWIVEWRALPANTIVSVVQGRPPLAMREYPSEALQGLFPEVHSPDGARLERRYIRYAGFGVRDRVSAMVHQVSGGDTTYDIPTGFSTPLSA
jgi:hypothetical protein